MKYFLTAILSVILFNISAAKISGNYGGNQCPKFYIGLYHHGRYECIDSVEVDLSGKFTVSFPDSCRGILLIACHNNKNASEALNDANNTSSLQLIYDGQDIIYETSWRWHNSDFYLRIPEGGETTKLTGILVKKQQELFERLASLEVVMDKTDRSSAFFTSVDNEYIETIKNYNRELRSIQSQEIQGSMFETVLICLLEPEIPLGLQGKQRIDWLREHLFDLINLNNPLVYNCPFFMNRLRHYLYLWQPKGLSPENEIKVSQSHGIESLNKKVEIYPDAIQQAFQNCLSEIMKKK